MLNTFCGVPSVVLTLRGATVTFAFNSLGKKGEC